MQRSVLQVQVGAGKSTLGKKVFAGSLSSSPLCVVSSFHPPETPASTTINHSKRSQSAAVAGDVTPSTKTNQARSSNERQRPPQINQW